MNFMEKYLYWIENADKETADELRTLADNEAELKDRFYKPLEFGTAGLRGVIGAGSNRMNKYTVAKATKGFADYICSKGEKAKADGIVIAHDNRRMSREFAEITAGVLAANGIKAYLFESLRSTPELSFSVRYLGCFGGVVITASHNPPEYNGYKLYDENGCQLIPSLADEVTKFVNAVEDELKVKVLSQEEAGELIEIVGEEIDETYYEELWETEIEWLTTDMTQIYYEGIGSLDAYELSQEEYAVRSDELGAIYDQSYYDVITIILNY